VADLLARRAAEDPGGVAFLEGTTGRTSTWGDLEAGAAGWRGRSDQLAGDRRIGLVVADPLVMIGAYLAALAAGVTVAPLNPDGAPPERLRQAGALGLAAVVTDDPTLRVGHLPCWVLDAPAPRPPRPGPATVPGAPAGDAAVILASSGTTGTPKIIPLTEAQLLHTAGALVAHHELSATDRGYCPLPLFHINALVVGVLGAVVSGGSLVVDRRFSASGFWRGIDRHGVTWLNLVPAIIGVLAAVDPPSPDLARRIAFARSASAPLPTVTRERFEAHTGIGVLETYGMTEAASQIAANPRRAADRRSGSVGRAVGLEIRVTERDGRPASTGEVGQVEIRGANVVEQYWAPWTGSTAEPEASRSAVSDDGWLATGDVGRMDEDGFVFLVGRLDDVINRGGEKVFPRDVEEVLLGDEDVTAAAVVGRPHPTVGHEPVAFVLARPEADRDALAIRLAARCEQHLSRFRRPVAITVADSLPAGPTGKIRHAELRRELAGTTGPLT
jgi:acyl-CoA synthetase (AMP-forming)/AMP-acid ligase II